MPYNTLASMDAQASIDLQVEEPLGLKSIEAADATAEQSLALEADAAAEQERFKVTRVAPRAFLYLLAVVLLATLLGMAWARSSSTGIGASREAESSLSPSAQSSVPTIPGCSSLMPPPAPAEVPPDFNTRAISDPAGYRTHRALVRGCDWSSIPFATYRAGVPKFRLGNLDWPGVVRIGGDDPSHPVEAGLTVDTCERTWGCGRWRYIVTRIGPFDLGPKSNRSMLNEVVMMLVPAAPLEEAFLTGSLDHIVDSNGEPLTYPPMHMVSWPAPQPGSHCRSSPCHASLVCLDVFACVPLRPASLAGCVHGHATRAGRRRGFR